MILTAIRLVIPRVIPTATPGRSVTVTVIPMGFRWATPTGFRWQMVKGWEILKAIRSG